MTNGAFHVPVQTRREVGFASQVKSKHQDSGTPKIGSVAFRCQHNIKGAIQFCIILILTIFSFFGETLYAKAFVLSSVLYYWVSIMHSSGIIFIIIFQLTQILYKLFRIRAVSLQSFEQFVIIFKVSKSMDNGELLSGCCLNLKLEEPFFSQTREELLTPPLCYFHGQDALADHTVAQQNDCSRNCSAIVKFLLYNLFKK